MRSFIFMALAFLATGSAVQSQASMMRYNEIDAKIYSQAAPEQNVSFSKQIKFKAGVSIKAVVVSPSSQTEKNPCINCSNLFIEYKNKLTGAAKVFSAHGINQVLSVKLLKQENLLIVEVNKYKSEPDLGSENLEIKEMLIRL